MPESSGLSQVEGAGLVTVSTIFFKIEGGVELAAGDGDEGGATGGFKTCFFI